MVPKGPSSLSTVGRCVANRPSGPDEISAANGRARISACSRGRSSTRNRSGRYIVKLLGLHRRDRYFDGPFRGSPTMPKDDCEIIPLSNDLERYGRYPPMSSTLHRAANEHPGNPLAISFILAYVYGICLETASV